MGINMGFKRRAGLTAVFFLLALTAGAERVTERRATITGGAGGGIESGKCTIEVSVDISAEVEVFGDRGVLRTTGGQDAAWKRMECSAPMPAAMAEFEFKGIDGRGRQTLVRDPRSNGGRAVVRIDDPRAGREGYTFDLIWHGGRNERTDPRDFGRPRREESVFADADMSFTGRGDGRLRWRGSEERLSDLELKISGGEVRATFHTSGGSTVYLAGKVTHWEKNHITADVSGTNTMGGTMYIDTDRDRVQGVSMNGGRSGELRWHRQ
jgi:hypothetical protein